MRIFWLTWVLLAALALRLAAASIHLVSDAGVVAAWSGHHAWGFARVEAWALDEFPQTFERIGEIVMMQGLYEVWRRLRAARLTLAGTV